MTSVKRHFGMIGALGRVALDSAFPPQCPSCRDLVAANGNFCAACFEKLRMITTPMCPRCGIPFTVMMEHGLQCADCLTKPPFFEQARAVMVYDAVSAPLISALKFHDQWTGIAQHAAMMVGAGGEVLRGADFLVPVPLHWRRLFHRKYNQSALLAYGISVRTGIPCAPELLQRVRATTPQMKLDRAMRRGNVKKAFAISPQVRARLEGKVLVLVDDVITTGSTVDACAQALKKAGAKEVRVLALARTVRE